MNKSHAFFESTQTPGPFHKLRTITVKSLAESQRRQPIPELKRIRRPGRSLKEAEEYVPGRELNFDELLRLVDETYLHPTYRSARYEKRDFALGKVTIEALIEEVLHDDGFSASEDTKRRVKEELEADGYVAVKRVAVTGLKPLGPDGAKTIIDPILARLCKGNKYNIEAWARVKGDTVVDGVTQGRLTLDFSTDEFSKESDTTSEDLENFFRDLAPKLANELKGIIKFESLEPDFAGDIANLMVTWEIQYIP